MKKRALKLRLGVGLVLLAGACLWAVMAQETNPYMSIAERNPFGLKPPPPPPEEPEAPAAPPAPAATVKLTGITSIVGPPKALIEITEPGPGKTARKLILSATERDGDLEVVSIDIEKDEVVIRNAGTLTNVTFAPTETAAAGPATAGKPGTPGSAPSPTPRVAAVAPNAAEPGGPTIISRNSGGSSSSRNSVTLLGGSSEPAATSPQAGAPRVGPTYSATSTAEAANRLRSIPSRTIRTNPQEGDPNKPAPPALTQEQLRSYLEAQRLIYEAAGDSKAKIIPIPK